MAETFYKTDWFITDYVNYYDWNRIESNILDLAQYLQSIEYIVPTPSVVTDRTVHSVPFLSMINRIENNLGAIHTAFGMDPPTYLAQKQWVGGQGFTYEDANRLENNTQIMKTYGQLIVQSYRYCGSFTCGEQGGLY